MNESIEPNIERESSEYMEKLREAIEDGKQFATTPMDEDYIERLEKELGASEREWEQL